MATIASLPCHPTHISTTLPSQLRPPSTNSSNRPLCSVQASNYQGGSEVGQIKPQIPAPNGHSPATGSQCWVKSGKTDKIIQARGSPSLVEEFKLYHNRIKLKVNIRKQAKPKQIQQSYAIMRSPQRLVTPCGPLLCDEPRGPPPVQKYQYYWGRQFIFKRLQILNHYRFISKLQNKNQVRICQMSQSQKQLNPKSSLLWNVVDPDDPYDIRKSMIARLPDHTQNFMGGNMEIVCLMQAAEIERLNTYLSQFKLRYRELQRKQLDRHSYQIQIKQLSQKSNEVGKLRIDNQKLREYIKKQSIELEELARRPNVSQSFQVEHQQLFKRYQSLLTQLQNSRDAINAQTASLNKCIEQNKQLRIKYDRLDKQRLTEITQERQKYELKIRDRIELEIKQVQHKYSSKIFQLESDCRLYKEQLESKNHEIASLMSRNQSLRRQLQNKQKQNQTTQQYEDKVTELQNINITLSRKAEDLQRIFEQYTKIETQLKDVQRAFQDSQQKNRFYRAEIDRLNQSRRDDGFKDQKIIELQNKSALLSQQIERLTYVLETKNRDLQQIDSKFASFRAEQEAKHRQLTMQYEQRLSNTKTGQDKIDALEAQLRPLRTLTIELKLKNQLLTKELSTTITNGQRCQELQNQLKKANNILIDKNNLILSLEARLKSGEASSFEMTTIKNSFMETTRLLRNVESIIGLHSGRGTEGATNQQIIKSILRQLEKKRELREELERQVLANHQLRTAFKETERLLNENNELIAKLRKQISDIKGSNEQYETDIKKGNLVSINVMDSEIRRHVDEARKKIQLQFERDFRKNLEDRASLERSNSELSHEKRTLQQEITVLREKLERKNVEIDQNYANIETRYMNQVHDLSNSLKAVREQNQKLTSERNKYKNALADFERQIGLKQKEQSDIIKDINKKCDELKYSNEDLRRENARLREGVAQAQDTVFRSQRQVEERLIKIYSSQLQDKDSIISSLERQVKTSRQQIKSLQAASENSSTSVKNYRDRLLLVSQQIERLNQILTNKNKQIDSLKYQLGSAESLRNQQLLEKDEEVRKIKIKLEDVDGIVRKQIHSKEEEIRRLTIGITYLEGQLMKRKTGDQDQERLRAQFENTERALREQIRQMQYQIRGLKNQIEAGDPAMRRQLAQKDEKINSLINEIKNLNFNLKIKQDAEKQNQQRVNRIRELELALQNSTADREYIRVELTEKLVKQNQEKNQVIERLTGLEKQYELTFNAYSQSATEAEQLKFKLAHQQDMKLSYQQTIRQQNLRLEQLQSYRIKADTHQRKIQEQDYQIRNLKQMLEQMEKIKGEAHQRKVQQQDYEIRNLKQMLKQMEDIKINTMRQRDHMLAINKEAMETNQKLMTQLEKFDNLGLALTQTRNRNREIESICLQYQQQLKDSEESNKALRNSNAKSSENLSMLSLQIQRLSAMLKAKDEQIERIKSKTDEGENMRRLTFQRQLQNRDIEIRNLKQMLQQMEEISLHTVAERDYLFDQSHEYKNVIDHLKATLAEKQRNVSEATFVDLKNAFQSLQIEYSSLQEKTKRYESSIEVTGRKNQEYEGKLRELITENDRLRLIIIERQKNVSSITELHERISELEIECTNSTEEAREWEQKYVSLYNAYKSESEMSKSKIAQYQKKITLLDQEMNGLERKFRTENEELRGRLASFDDLIEKNRALGAQIDRLNVLLANLKQDLSDTRLRLTDQMALEKRIQEYMSLMVILFAEIETLRNRVSQTEIECENVRRSSLTPHRVDRQVGRSLDSRDKSGR